MPADVFGILGRLQWRMGDCLGIPPGIYFPPEGGGQKKKQLLSRLCQLIIYSVSGTVALYILN